MLSEIVLGSVGLGVVACLIGVGSFKRVATLAGRCELAESEVEAHLRRRHRLIPSLVATAKGAAAHEGAMLDAVMGAHRDTLEAGSRTARFEAEGILSARLAEAMARLERYTDLQILTDFAELRREMDEVENAIFAARRHQNLAAAAFNNAIAHFPDSLIAARLGLEARRPYDIGMGQVIVEDAAAARS